MLFLRRLSICAFALAFWLTGLPAEWDGFGVPAAQAQSAAKGERKSLFRAIFGRKKAKRKVVKKRVKSRRTKKRRVRRRKAKSSTANQVAARKAAEKVDKVEDARKVLVVGDFFANSLSDGLREAFAKDPSIAVINRTSGLSGFVRSDIVNWPQVLSTYVEEEKPQYIVLMAGSNDRQLLREGGVTHKKRTPGWDEAYLKRIAAMGAALKATDLPFTWVGLPSVRFGTMSRDYLTFNEWYAKATEGSPKGKFVDVWDGFADADGNYSRSGPDINGQITLLRRKDGINMTDAGDRRLAFYVENDVKRALEGKSPIGDPLLANEFDGLAGRNTELSVYDPAKTGRTIVVNLDDPVADGGEVLAGATVKTKAPKTGGAELPVPALGRSDTDVKREGRVDDFAWPARDFASSTPPAQSVAQGPATSSELRR